jgi:hypothetical protein
MDGDPFLREKSSSSHYNRVQVQPPWPLTTTWYEFLHGQVLVMYVPYLNPDTVLRQVQYSTWAASESKKCH